MKEGQREMKRDIDIYDKERWREGEREEDKQTQRRKRFLKTSSKLCISPLVPLPFTNPPFPHTASLPNQIAYS